MANQIITPLMVTRESLRILHGKLSLIGSANRQYDSRFAQEGAKIGQTLNIRQPPKYTVRTGANLSAQDYVERSTPLSVSSQIGVDVSFTTADLTMNLNEFSDKFLKAPIAQLAAYLEASFGAMAYKYIANYVGATNAVMTYKSFQQAGQKLTENLAPTADRTAHLTPAERVFFSDAVKGLFQASDNIEEQYREGMMGRTGGMDVFENTYLPQHTRGTLAGASLLTGASLGTSTTSNVWVSQTDLSVDGANTGTTLKAGDVITISGVYDVHPETKQNTGKLKNFVVQSDVTLTTQANTYTVTVKPGLIYGSGNAYQNAVLSGVTNTDNNTVTAFGVAGTAYGQDLMWHKDAFVFATADLIDVSQYGAWGARATQDGISMRVAKQYAIATDTVPCRIDVLWGAGPLYPELACRHFYDLTST